MMIHRRRLLQAAGAAATLAAPRIARSQDKKVLRFVPYVDLAILDPMINTAAQTRTHGYMVFDTLYAQDADYRAQPEMVAGHQIDDDFKLWTLTLRDGLRFHDGSPVLARDVVASLKRWGAADPAGRALFAVVAEITAPSDKVVRLRMKQPYRLLPDVLGKIAPSMACIMPERLADTPATKALTEMVGSGPFRFVAAERVSGSKVVYERFEGYVPRPGGSAPGLTSGPKLVNVDRVEWITMPEPATAAAALQAGEVDWWEVPSSDLLPLLRQRRNLATEVKDKTGVLPILRFNSLQAPFDNPAIRRAVLSATRQSEFMEAFSSERSEWHDHVGLFTPGTPMATTAGLDRFAAAPDIAAAKKAIEAAGYKGERVVVMQPTDHPVNNAMSQVGADLFKRIGLNVDLQAMDAGTMFQRRANREGVDKGGWSAFPSMVGGADALNPAVSFLTRGNGADAWYGWPTIPALETERSAWFEAPDLEAQQTLCSQMQLTVLNDPPHIQLGQILQPTSYRTDITGVLDGFPKFWNVQKT
ncbi:MAG: ABC transporter substrate-binding protein [Janthinobacterium lividum]